MSELQCREGEHFDSWLEKELNLQLSPVTAPDSLWNQIHEQRRPLRVRQPRWLPWSIAAAALLVLSAGAAWKVEKKLEKPRDQFTDLANLAARELHELTAGAAKTNFRADLRSSDPREIQNWLRARLDVDLQLPASSALTNRDVQLLGAGLVPLNETSAAVITYRVGNDFAAMLVTNRSGSLTKSVSRHPSAPFTSAAGFHIYSWSEGRQDYALAWGGAEPRGACLLCHVGMPALMLPK